MRENLSNQEKKWFSMPIGYAFHHLGWLGFWLQVVLAFIPVSVLLFALLVLKTSAQGIETIIEVILAYGCLLSLGFSIFWSFRYTKLGRSLAATTRPLSLEKITKTLWLGVTVNLSCMVVTVLVAIGAIGTMLFRVLTLPPGAIPLFDQRQGLNLNANQWIVPLDVVWLQALINTIAAQLVGVVISLLLFYRVNNIRNNKKKEKELES
jgi:hypothetical protein